MLTGKNGKRIFSSFEEEPVQELTLEELGQTHLENYPDGTPVGDIYHYNFINWLQGLLISERMDFDMSSIFVANNKFKRSPGVTILPEIAARDGEGSLNSHICRRVFCNINLKGHQHGKSEVYNIAVAYTQLGISVGFGPYTYACKNQTICNAERIISNYTIRGNERTTSEERKLKVMMLQIEKAVKQISAWAERDFDLLDKLREVYLDGHQIGEFIGMLMVKRNIANSPNPLVRRNITAPLNTPEINDLTQKILDNKLLDGCTGYDLLMAGNSYYKPRKSPFENISAQSAALTTMLGEFLELRIEN